MLFKDFYEQECKKEENQKVDFQDSSAKKSKESIEIDYNQMTETNK